MDEYKESGSFISENPETASFYLLKVWKFPLVLNYL